MFFFNNKSTEFKIIKRKKYIKKLIIPLVKKAGRSHTGQLILVGLGGGYKRFYRLLDFKRFIIYIPFKIIAFEYDPNRNIFIMLVLYFNGILSYYLAPLLVKLNSYLINNNILFQKNGSSFSILNCLVGSSIHCVKINSIVAKYARAAGTYVQLVRKIGSYVLVRLSSKEEMIIYGHNLCVLGRLSNVNVKLIKKSSAGYFRRLGLKSKVRGVAKNPVDHPHGGGQGKTSAGQPSVSPWGIYTKGVRTTTRFKRLNFNKWGFFRRRDGLVW